VMARALAIVRPLTDEIGQAGAAGQGERLREGLRVAIAGPPNAGKSTLFNRLARRDAAIVSPFPGTTRDVLEIHLDLGGYPVTVLDTAGIRETADPVEREGVRRASEQAADADLVLWVLDATTGGRKTGSGAGLPTGGSAGSELWVVVNKMDLVSGEKKGRVESRFGGRVNVNFLSSTTGAGVDELVKAIAQFAERFFSSEPALVTRERHRAHLREASLALLGVQRAAEDGKEEIVAEQLRLAARALGRLLGRVDVEDILDVIFRDFCIGK
jgi:tRNA modification GTPase